MTWHAKALQTSYLSRPRSGSHTSAEDDAAFPFTTTSWYFLDAVDVMAPANTVVVCAFGDSITDGTLSTLNGDDRWPDVLSRRLHARVRQPRVGGERRHRRQSDPDARKLSAAAAVCRRAVGAAAARARSLRVVRTVGGRAAGRDQRHQRGRIGRRDHRRHEGARVARQSEGASRSSARRSRRRSTANGNSGTPDANARRQAVNAFIRTGGLFDAVADFDAATVDPQTGALREEFVPNSTIGGAGDRLHPESRGVSGDGIGGRLENLCASCR